MSPAFHIERHFGGSRRMRDIVIGMSDGLTVPFALAAGLSGTLNSAQVVITAGLAEIAAGSIAMGLGGFLAAHGDADHYASEEQREWSEIAEKPAAEEAEVIEVLSHYGLTTEEITPLIAGLKRQPGAWVEFMMRFELGLDRPAPQQAVSSAMTIALSYVAGGLVPLSPYFFASGPRSALPISTALTLAALAIFGFVKGRFIGIGPLRSAVQTTAVGGAAAVLAYGIARAVGAS